MSALPREIDGISIREAGPGDGDSIRRVLKSAGLPFHDVDDKHFHVAVADDMIVGTIALEPAGKEDGLLRSMAVQPKYRTRGIGRRLFNAVVRCALERGIRRLFLFTTDAADYFARFGFTHIERESLPAGIRNTSQYRDQNCLTAVTMQHQLTA